MTPQKSLSGFKINHGRVGFVWLPVATYGSVQHGQHRVNRGENMGFRSPERRETYSRESELQRSEVTTPQRDVVEQVLGALAVTRVNLLERVTRIRHKAKQIPADMKELVNQFLKLGSHVSLGRNLSDYHAGANSR
jgi:hypothetical protein